MASPPLAGVPSPPPALAFSAPSSPLPRLLFATFATAAVGDFLLNWAALVREAGIPNTDIVVASFDAQTDALCAANGLPTHANPALRLAFDGVATGGSALGNASSAKPQDGRPFQRIGALKAQFLLDLLDQGAEACSPRPSPQPVHPEQIVPRCSKPPPPLPTLRAASAHQASRA